MNCNVLNLVQKNKFDNLKSIKFDIVKKNIHNKFFIMKFLAIVIIFCYCSVSVNGQTDNSPFLTNLNNYLSNLRLKSYVDSTLLYNDVKEYGPVELFNIRDSTFTIGHYLKIFDKLSLKDSSKLDFLFASSRQSRGRIDSRLKIYAYRDTITLNRLVKNEMQSLIMHWDSITQSKIKINKVEKDPLFDKKIKFYYAHRNRINYRYAFSQYIWHGMKDTVSYHFEPEKSKEGYLQYLAFYLMEKTGLNGGGYNGTYFTERIIASTTDLKKIFEDHGYTNDPGFNQKFANELLNNWPYPIIEMYDNQCFITLMETLPWRDTLARRKYRIDLSSLKITRLNEELFRLTSYASFD